MIECPACHADNNDGESACWSCGASLEGTAASSQPAALVDRNRVVSDGGPDAAAPGSATNRRHRVTLHPISSPTGSPAADPQEEAEASPEADHAAATREMKGGAEAGLVATEETARNERVSGEAKEADVRSAAGGATETGYGQAARKMVLERLGDDRPTIGVIGNYNVGKTFFIKQVERAAKARAFTHDCVKIDPAEEPGGGKRVSAEKKPKKGAPKQSERFEATLNVWIHDFDGPDGAFRLIDIPGEFFLAALDGRGGLRQIENPRVAMLYPALACSSALILIVPAHHALGESGADKAGARAAVELLGSIRMACNLLESVQKDRGGRAVEAVEEVLSLGPRLTAEMSARSGGKSSKPITVLFSQADRCFGVGESRNSMGLRGDLPEHDPLLCAAKRLPELVLHLKDGFRDFRVDFLTAAEGQKANDKKLKDDTRSIGVWQPISTLLERIRQRVAAPAGSRLPPLIRRLLLLDRLQDCEQTTGWAVTIRAKADKEFGSALEL